MEKIIGEENIKILLFQFLEKNKNGAFRSILTGKPLVYYFGDDFAEKFMQNRVEKNIFLQSLRLTDNNFDTQKHKNYSGYLKEIQHINPEEIIVGDVIFFSEKKLIIFYVNNEKIFAEIYEDIALIGKYKSFFEKYWKN